MLTLYTVNYINLFIHLFLLQIDWVDWLSKKILGNHSRHPKKQRKRARVTHCRPYYKLLCILEHYDSLTVSVVCCDNICS